MKRQRTVALGPAAAILCLGITCGSVVGALGATRSSPLRPLHTDSAVVADDRYAVFTHLNSNHIVIRDTKTRRSVNYSTACLPPGSDSFRRGYLLLECPSNAPQRYLVLRVRDRAVSAIQHVPDGVLFYGVGRFWVAGARGNPDGTDQQSVYLNWHTGEVRSYPGAYQDPPRNLNDPQLRKRAPGIERGEFPRRLGRYVITHPSKGKHAGELRLHNVHKTILLSRCLHECNFVETVPGLVFWAERTAVRGYALRSGRRLRWPRSRNLRTPAVVGSGYELFIVDYIDDPEIVDNPQTRLYVTEWRDALR